MTGPEERLVDALAVLDALRPVQDLSVADAEIFGVAWQVALERAMKAARDYTRTPDGAPSP